MMSIFRKISPLLILLFGLSLSGCVEGMAQPKAKVDTGLEQQLPPYTGPKAAVARFE
ncbi:MAG: hypothetical protein AB1348_06780 [Nitrospirota bacterium]